MLQEFDLREVRSIFETAVGLEEGSRSAYLDEACRIREIRRRVDLMIEADESGDWLDPATLIDFDALADELPSVDLPVHDRIGRYKVKRRILIEHVRAKLADCPGDGNRHSDPALEHILAAPIEDSDCSRLEKGIVLLLLNDALDRMESEDPRRAEMVKLRFFAGLSIQDTARALEVSTMTVSRDWRCAKAWLCAEMFGDIRA